MKTYQKGFSLIEVVIILVIIGFIGFVGVKAWDAFQNKAHVATTSSTTGSSTSVTPSSVPAVNSSADLDKVTKLLDTTNIDGSESTQLNQQTSF